MNRKLIALAATLLVACTSSENRASVDSAISPAPEEVQDVQLDPSASSRADTSSQTPAPPPATGKWTVTPRGIGNITAGMTVEEAYKALGNFPASAKLAECDFIRPKGTPDGVAFLVENSRISSVVIRSGTISTAEGIAIGDTEQKIKPAYGDRVAVQPHKYDPKGHTLTVTPKNPADSDYRIVFETDGSKVLQFRSGKLPAVAYVEGCG
jgi:hypothetical protein